MTDLLSNYLARAGRSEWHWGTVDCVMFMADWVKLQSDRDFAAAWRGHYHTPRGAQRIIVRAGGIEPLLGNALERLGWRRTNLPARGDIGLVAAPVAGRRGKLQMGKVGAICLASRLWAVKPSDRMGMAAADFTPLTAWTGRG